MQEQTSSLWTGIAIGALVMFFLVNFLSNNFFFASLVSQNSCSMMHGSYSSFHHLGFWLTLTILVIFAVLAYHTMHDQKKRVVKK